MSKQNTITQENFDSLLDWLDSSREAAGLKYEKIRQRLIWIFTCRGCFEAEDLADETINRVMNKLPDLAGSYTGEPKLYFYGVANHIHLEWLRKQKKFGQTEIEKQEIRSRPAEAVEDDDYRCLEKCLEKLPTEQRSLIVDYYKEEKRAKIEHRRNLAEKLGIGLNVLQVRAHRIRAVLHECVQNCVDGKKF